MTTNNRILFMGTPQFAVASLNALIEAGFDVAAVVTAPDKPAGRGRQLRSSQIKERALELGLPVLQPERLRDPSFLEELERLHASLYVVVAFRMLPEVVWSKPALGTINLHGSLLPHYRGAAPINWAIINGEERTGVTTFFIRHEVDTGDMIAQRSVTIGPETNAGELHDELMAVGAELLVSSVSDIFNGTVERKAQPGHAAEYTLNAAPKLDPDKCRIDWSASATTVHDLIRGLSPFPGAHTTLRYAERDPVKFKLFSSRMISGEPTDLAPGSIRTDDGRLIVACGSGSLEAIEIQPEGKRRMNASEFLRGLHSSNGLTFE